MDRPSRRPVPTWVPFAVLFAAGGYLLARWDAIPNRWVIHWSAAGTPNGWALRTPAGVLGPLLLGAATIGFVEFVFAIARRRANTATALAPVRAATTHLIRAVTLAVALVFAVLAIDLPLGPRVSPGALTAIILLVLVVAIGTGASHIVRALREVRAGGNGDKVEGHHAFYYSNPKDPRLWVPKLSGTGLTINFAHPWAWPVMLLLAGVPVALVIASMFASRS